MGAFQPRHLSSAKIIMMLHSQSCMHVCTHTYTRVSYPLPVFISTLMLVCISTLLTHTQGDMQVSYIFECIHRASNNYFCTLASCEHKSLYVYTYTLQYTHPHTGSHSGRTKGQDKCLKNSGAEDLLLFLALGHSLNC